MKATKNWSKMLLAGMAAMVLAFGLILAGCDDGGGSGGGNNTGGNNTGGNTDPKTIIITGLTQAQKNEGSTSFTIAVFATGVTPNLSSPNYVAIAQLGGIYTSVVISGASAPYTATGTMYDDTGMTIWTGHGTYDVYIAADNGSTTVIYKKANVSINAASVTLDGTTFASYP